MKHLGERLRKARESKGFSQEYVAECLQISVASVCRMEKDPLRAKLGLVMRYILLLDRNVEDMICAVDSRHKIQHVHVCVFVDAPRSMTKESTDKIARIISEELKEHHQWK